MAIRLNDILLWQRQLFNNVVRDDTIIFAIDANSV